MPLIFNLHILNPQLLLMKKDLQMSWEDMKMHMNNFKEGERHPTASERLGSIKGEQLKEL